MGKQVNTARQDQHGRADVATAARVAAGSNAPAPAKPRAASSFVCDSPSPVSAGRRVPAAAEERGDSFLVLIGVRVALKCRCRGEPRRRLIISDPDRVIDLQPTDRR
jgi:hypothetical protein